MDRHKTDQPKAGEVVRETDDYVTTHVGESVVTGDGYIYVDVGVDILTGVTEGNEVLFQFQSERGNSLPMIMPPEQAKEFARNLLVAAQWAEASGPATRTQPTSIETIAVRSGVKETM